MLLTSMANIFHIYHLHHHPHRYPQLTISNRNTENSDDLALGALAQTAWPWESSFPAEAVRFLALVLKQPTEMAGSIPPLGATTLPSTVPAIKMFARADKLDATTLLRERVSRTQPPHSNLKPQALTLESTVQEPNMIFNTPTHNRISLINPSSLLRIPILIRTYSQPNSRTTNSNSKPSTSSNTTPTLTPTYSNRTRTLTNPIAPRRHQGRLESSLERLVRDYELISQRVQSINDARKPPHLRAADATKLQKLEQEIQSVKMSLAAYSS